MSRLSLLTFTLIMPCLLITPALSAQRGGGGGGGGGGSRGGSSGRATTIAADPAPRGDASVAALSVDPASHLAGIAKAMSSIDSALAVSAPAALSKADQADWDGETRWLTASKTQLSQISKKLGTFAKGVAKVGLGVAGARSSGDTATTESKPDAQQIADANVRFLALQKQLTTAGERRYQTISNASKARHEMVMNAIRNMK